MTFLKAILTLLFLLLLFLLLFIFMQILIGSNNAGKIIEIREALESIDVEILSPNDLGSELEPPAETGSTYAANALQKARYYYMQTGLPTVADDSGIVIEALQDELGVHTRRWGAGPEASDEEWITYFLERMSREGNKNASFICVIAYIDEQGEEHVFEGVCDGLVTESLEAEYLPGLPIAACFKPHGCDEVFSAMSVEKKNEVSHRGKATALLRNHLESQ